MVDWFVEYLTHGFVPYETSEPKPHDTGYREGGLYFCCGFRLKEGAEISLIPPAGHELALLDYRWLPYEEAVQVLREQPNVGKVPKAIQIKVEKILIPAMEAFREHERELSLLDRIE